MTKSTSNIQLSRIIGKDDKILVHLKTATQQLNGEGGSAEEMIGAVRTAYELTLALREFLTPDID
jgi:hypothetical protein